MTDSKKHDGFRQELYVVYDKVAGEGSSPYPAVNDDVACRNFLRAIKDSEYPQDFKLMKVGRYNAYKPKIEVCEPTEVFVPKMEAQRDIAEVEK